MSSGREIARNRRSSSGDQNDRVRVFRASGWIVAMTLGHEANPFRLRRSAAFAVT